jgi:5-methylcytosine-specific restriction protein A
MTRPAREFSWRQEQLARHLIGMPRRPPIHRPFRRPVRDDRPSAAARGYDRRWQRYRLAFLREHPLCECEECKAVGRLLPSSIVDHVIPHRGDMELFWDPGNHQAMSKPCHDRKTALCDGAFGRPLSPQRVAE